MISIVLITVMLAVELFYLTQLHSFIGYYFEYLPLIYPSHVFVISLTRFNYFKVFWPSLFISPSVKGIDNFCKFQGVIDGFNGSRRQIASGVKNGR